LDYDIPKGSFQTWDSIKWIILNCSDEVKDIIYKCGKTKNKVEDKHQLAGLKQCQKKR
jgi:hypothetical protein